MNFIFVWLHFTDWLAMPCPYITWRAWRRHSRRFKENAVLRKSGRFREVLPSSRTFLEASEKWTHILSWSVLLHSVFPFMAKMNNVIQFLKCLHVYKMQFILFLIALFATLLFAILRSLERKGGAFYKQANKWMNWYHNHPHSYTLPVEQAEMFYIFALYPPPAEHSHHCDHPV